MYRFIRSLFIFIKPRISPPYINERLEACLFFWFDKKEKYKLPNPIMIMGLKFPNRVGLAAGSR
jgi:hypothetical protein